MIKLTDIYAARKRIKKWVRRTPLEYSPKLSEIINGSVYLKLENQQVTRSFKIRGARVGNESKGSCSQDDTESED